MRTTRGIGLPRRALFVDRSVGGRIVPDALRRAGEAVTAHDELLPPDAPDPAWIELIASRDWIGITRDERLEYAHRSIVEASGARIFLLRSGGALRGDEMAAVLVDALEALHRLDSKHDAPFIAHISRTGTVSMPLRYGGQRRNPRRTRQR